MSKLEFKTKKIMGYTTIPKSFLEDNRLSAMAKGFLATLYHSRNVDALKESKEEKVKCLSELNKYGYVEITNNEIIVNPNPIIKLPKSQSPKRKKVIEVIKERIEEFTTDELLRERLLVFFTNFISHAKGTRYETAPPLKKESALRLLSELRLMKGNLLDIVNFAIEKEYYKFVEIPKNNKAKITYSDDKDEVFQ